MTIKIEGSVEIDTSQANRNIQQFARDTGKQLDKATLIKLEVDLATLKLAKKEARDTLKELQAQYKDGLIPQSAVIEAQIAFDRISNSTTEAQRKLRNYKNTGDETLSRLQVKFNSVTDEIKKTRDTLAEAGKDTKGLDNLIKKADELEKEFKQGNITQKQFIDGMKELQNEVNKANNNLNGYGFSMVKLNAILEVAQKGINALKGIYNSWLSTLGENEQYERLYRIVNNVTGATREQVKVLNEQAKALSAIGVVSAGNITQVQSQLATFDLQIETIKTLTPAILDYVTAEKGASATTEEFKQAANSLAQALNGNFQSLTRVGFVLDENTKKQISNGTEMERAEAIVRVLNSTYRGFNQALAETPLGKIQNLRNRFNDLKDTILDNLTPAFSRAIEIISNFLEKLEDPQDIIKKYQIKINNTEALIKTLEKSYKDGKITLEEYEFALLQLQSNIDGYNKKLLETENKQKTFISVLIESFKSMVSTIGNFFKSLGLFFAGTVSGFLTGLTAIGEGTGQTIGFITNNFSALANNAKVIVAKVGGGIAKLVDDITGGIANIINSSIEGLNKLPFVNIKRKVSGTKLFKGGDVGNIEDIKSNFNLEATKKLAKTTADFFKQSGEAFGNAFSKGTKIGIEQALEDGKRLQEILNKSKAGLTLLDEGKNLNLGGGGLGGLKNNKIKTEKEIQDELKKLREEEEKKEQERQKRKLETEAYYKIQSINNSNRTEEEKAKAIIKINDELQKELRRIGKTQQELQILEAEELIKKNDEIKRNKKEYLEIVNTVFEKAGKIQENYRKKIEEVTKEFNKLKETALKNIEDINNNLEELNLSVDTKLAERRLKILEEEKKLQDDLQKIMEKSSTEENQKEINNLLEKQISLKRELAIIEKNVNAEILKAVEERAKLSETERILADKKAQEQILIERKKIYEAILNGEQIMLDEIKDKKNKAIAEELIVKVDSINKELEIVKQKYQKEIEEFKKSDEFKRKIEKDYTDFLRGEIDKRILDYNRLVEASRRAVAEANRLAAEANRLGNQAKNTINNVNQNINISNNVDRQSFIRELNKNF